jgi:exo-1,4-beta-D-glucosaminidase
MIGDKKRHKFACAFLFAMVLTGCQTEGEREDMVWMVQSSDKVSVGGEVLSTPAAQTEGWIKAKVPSTIMGVLTENGIEKEALTADDYAKIDKTRFEKSWWYRTMFEMPELKEGEHVLLDFDGICYRANVWLNGQQIANSQEMAGSFRQFKYDVTKEVDKENVLAVEVFRAQSGEPNIGFVDWNPRPADESMGIYREVRVKTCGNVTVSHSAVRSKVNTETLDEAWLTVVTELKNLSDQSVEGVVKGTADGQAFSCPVTLAAGEKRRFTLPTEIHIDHPRLWWCHNMGKPELCDLHLEFVENDKVSDSEDVKFGIREVKSYLTDEGYRGFTLNGKKVLLRGAGWTDDIYLRDTPESNRLQLEYVRDMNMNTVRLEGFWGTSQSLYDLCDELGLLILVGWSCHWEWESYLGSPTEEPYGGIISPENIALVAQSFEDQVMWLRYHPSIIGWFVGSDRIPKPELEKQYQQFLSQEDDRDYIISAKNLESEISGWSGTKMAGPYEYVGPSYWYLPEAPGGAFGFNTETGIGAQLPVKESLQKMLGQQLFPIDSRWNILCTASSSEMNTLGKLSEVIQQRFGEAKDIDEYLYRADMLNYESTKAMFESFRVRWPHTTGIVQWMLNSARPSIYWQLYDYYLQPNAAYYGVKKANAPVQLIYDYYTKAVYAVNETMEPVSFKASMKLLKGEQATDKSMIRPPLTPPTLGEKELLQMLPGAVVKVFDVDTKDAAAAFLLLKLTDEKGAEIAGNEYFIVAEKDTYDWAKTNWVHTPIIKYGSYAMLDNLCTKSCELSVKPLSEGLYEATVSNPSDKVAFMVRLKAKDQNGELICPAYWSDNYLTLAPGESRTVTCRMPSLAAETTVNIQLSE